MPLVRISIPNGKDVTFNQTVGEAIHDAMVATIGVPKDDRFQILAVHNKDELMYDKQYLGVDRSNKCIFIQITMNSGRTPAQKKALYATVADNLHTRAAWRKQDVMIVLSENHAIDWSFGNGEAQGVEK